MVAQAILQSAEGTTKLTPGALPDLEVAAEIGPIRTMADETAVEIDPRTAADATTITMTATGEEMEGGM